MEFTAEELEDAFGRRQSQAEKSHTGQATQFPKAKLLIGVGKGKKNYDKRATARDRDWNRDKARIMKEGGRG